jgi:hypothetical protein
MWDQQPSKKPGPSFFPKKLLGMSGELLRYVLMAFVGLALQLVLFLVKRGKTRRLEEIRRREEEEQKERMRMMEEEWKRQEEEEMKKGPEFVLQGNQ